MMNEKKSLIVAFFIFFTFASFGNSLENQDEEKKENRNSLKVEDLVTDDSESKEKKDNEEQISFALEVDKSLKIAHSVSATLTNVTMWSSVGVGAALLVNYFTGFPVPEVYPGLQIAHIALASAALASYASLVVLGFTKLGLKMKAGLPIRTKHLVTAGVSLGFFILEVASVILSAVFFANRYKGAEWMGLAHGIVSTVTAFSVSISVVTILIK